MEPTPQERFWTEFYHAKVHACYLELILGRAVRFDLAATIGTALVFGGAAAGLSLWKSFDPAAGVALSLGSAGASIAAVQRYLPFKQLRKPLGALANDYHLHVIWAEAQWPKVAEMTDQQVIRLREEFQTKLQKAEYKHFPDSDVPDIPRLLRKATVRANAHFKNFYGSVIQ